jgi:hypothetical protein
MVVDRINKKTLLPILQENMDREARLLTDEGSRYGPIGREFAVHQAVSHRAKKYVRASDRTIHTNTVEGYFSIFKRGMKGVYQHCGKRHLHRYLAEYDFRYRNRMAQGVNDTERADRGLDGVIGAPSSGASSTAGWTLRREPDPPSVRGRGRWRARRLAPPCARACRSSGKRSPGAFPDPPHRHGPAARRAWPKAPRATASRD